MPDSLPVGGSIPPNTPHAVSVSLPTWDATVGYEKGEAWVVGAMTTGYPRFFVHKSIQSLVSEIITRFGKSGDDAMLFPSAATARCCHEFMVSRIPPEEILNVRIIHLTMPRRLSPAELNDISSELHCVIFPETFKSVAKQVWQHSGSGISSRRGEFCLKALKGGYLVQEPCNNRGKESEATVFHKGPKRYQKVDASQSGNGAALHRTKSPTETGPATSDGTEFSEFIEERFGRNLSISYANNAKLAVKKRIAGSLTSNAELHEALESHSGDSRIPGLTEDHIYLYPTGMNSIFTAHQTLLKLRGDMKSICYGFPYVDTLKILQKWGPGVLFYGRGLPDELDDLEKRLESGERYLALFTEFPGNPLLRTPDLERIYALAAKYDFAVVVDESVGNFINVNVLPYADVVVSSLTKVFSGDSNVMGGSAIFNPHGRYYAQLKDILPREHEDNYWAEDAIFLERNSRDFVSRIERINASTEAATALLEASPLVKQVYYPKNSPTRPFYDKCRNQNGGYGGLFSVIFNSSEAAMAFFDNLEVMKGPSLGTNFTLSCPYTILAHYDELDWVKSMGVAPELVRISVGLEEWSVLESKINHALEAVSKIPESA
ncbi:hypothetical protein FQN57_002165 [Myotisia sp. PD_48]|nr:hypothetical protein FQN57_002165 [Myotisia sp. PD_48]